MTTPELLAACRAALAEQKAVEAAAHPVPWVDLTESLGSIVSNPPGNEAYSDVVEAIVDPDDAAEIVQSRNADPARLAVAEEQLGYAQACWDDLMDTVGDDEPTAEQLAEMYDGTPHINIAAILLGVAVD